MTEVSKKVVEPEGGGNKETGVSATGGVQGLPEPSLHEKPPFLGWQRSRPVKHSFVN